jgi:hypothetical protein
MGQNTLPSGISDLLLLADRIAHGLETHGPWLEMTQIPADELRRIHDQVRKADTAWSAARSAKASAESRMTAADEALTAWLTKARLVVMLARGAKWSEHWIETGFTHRGMNIPKRIEPRIALARRLVVFLALHPDFGVPFADVTAARGRCIYERMIHTSDHLEVTTADCIMCKRQHAAAERALRRTMRQVILILGSTIAPADPRWLAFGLNRPAPNSPPTHHHRRRGGFTEPPAKPISLPAETHSDCQHTVAA